MDANGRAPLEPLRITPKSFLMDMLAGVGIGTAFIIPGFSGGSMAVIFGIYDKLIGAIAGIFKDVKRSVLTLLPIGIGLVIGALSLLYPIKLGLEAFPLPTVSLFVGLALGGLLSVKDEICGRFSPVYIASILLPLALVLSISFLPGGSDVDLFGLEWQGYVVLFLVGALGSAALVVPGISGSMILLILGYYNPIVAVITDHFFKGVDLLESFLILMSVGLGIVTGFIIVSIIMKKLLSRFRRGTFYAILGFIVGSIPSVYISTAKDAGYTDGLPTDPIHWIACVLLLCLGCAISVFLILKAGKKSDQQTAKEAK